MVVCTLCSCYPWPVLGLPPTWYKSAPYRSRAVKDPRGVLADFGVQLPEATQFRIWDSTAEVVYGRNLSLQHQVTLRLLAYQRHCRMPVSWRSGWRVCRAAKLC